MRTLLLFTLFLFGCWNQQRNYHRLMWAKSNAEIGFRRDQSSMDMPGTDGRSFFMDIGGAIVALDVASGERRWYSRVSEDSVPRVANFTVYDDQLLFSLSGVAFALDRSNGRIEWRTRVDTLSNDAQLAADSSTVYVGQSAGITALDRLTGEFRWMAWVRDSSAMGARTTGVSISGDTVFVAVQQWQFSPTNEVSRKGRVAALDRDSGKRIWLYTSTGDSASVNGAGATGGHMIVFSDVAGGSFFALDRNTGKERWRVTGDRETGPAGSRASPIIRNDTVYVGSTNSWIYAVDLDTGRPIWLTETEGSINAIAICEDLLLANNGRIEFIDRFSGRRHQPYLGGHEPSQHAGSPSSGIAITGNLAMVAGTETVVGFRCGKHVRD